MKVYVFEVGYIGSLKYGDQSWWVINLHCAITSLTVLSKSASHTHIPILCHVNILSMLHICMCLISPHLIVLCLRQMTMCTCALLFIFVRLTFYCAHRLYPQNSFALHLGEMFCSSIERWHQSDYVLCLCAWAPLPKLRAFTREVNTWPANPV